MGLDSAVPVAHLVATLFMAGLIVFVQVVHYPLMSRIGAADFPGYESAHMRRTGWVVVPAMLTELVAAAWLVVAHPPGEAATVFAGLALLGVIWGSTAFVQAPLHRRLALGFDRTTHRRLVASNWVRTACWIGRVPIALGLVL